MGILYLLAWLIPLLIIAACFVGFLFLFLTSRYILGTGLLLLGLFGAYQWTGFTIDVLFGLALPTVTLAGFVASIVTINRNWKAWKGWIVLLCSVAMLWVIHISPQRPDVAFLRTHWEESETPVFDAYIGIWPALGEVGIVLEMANQHPAGDYFTDAPGGNHIFSTKLAPFSSTQFTLAGGMKTGSFKAMIYVAQGFWQSRTTFRSGIVVRDLELVITDADGNIGKRAALHALKGAFRKTFGAQYVPLLSGDNWSFSELRESNGQWCVSGQFVGSQFDTQGEGCLDSGGLNGTQSSYAMADVQFQSFDELPADQLEKVSRIRASMPKAVALYHELYPDRMLFRSAYLDEDYTGYDPSWVRYEGNGEWFIFLSLFKDGARYAPHGLSYLLSLDGAITLK